MTKPVVGYVAGLRLRRAGAWGTGAIISANRRQRRREGRDHEVLRLVRSAQCVRARVHGGCGACSKCHAPAVSLSAKAAPLPPSPPHLTHPGASAAFRGKRRWRALPPPRAALPKLDSKAYEPGSSICCSACSATWPGGASQKSNSRCAASRCPTPCRAPCGAEVLQGAGHLVSTAEHRRARRRCAAAARSRSNAVTTPARVVRSCRCGSGGGGRARRRRWRLRAAKPGAPRHHRASRRRSDG